MRAATLDYMQGTGAGAAMAEALHLGIHAVNLRLSLFGGLAVPVGEHVPCSRRSSQLDPGCKLKGGGGLG